MSSPKTLQPFPRTTSRERPNDSPAERLISADPDAGNTAGPEQMGEQAYADDRRAIHTPDTVHAIRDAYRPRLRLDRLLDDDDRSAGLVLASTTLVLRPSA